MSMALSTVDFSCVEKLRDYVCVHCSVLNYSTEVGLMVSMHTCVRNTRVHKCNHANAKTEFLNADEIHCTTLDDMRVACRAMAVSRL